MKQRNSGITLIALIITIIVLLILAGVTISAITGENGIILTTIKAKEKSAISSEIEILNYAVTNSMKNNRRGNLVNAELQKQLDLQAGKEQTIVTTDTEEQGYFVKFVDSERIYKVSIDGDVTYLGKEIDLLTQAEIIANPEKNTTPQLIQQVELTVKTPIKIENVDYSLVYAWSSSKDKMPDDSKFMQATLDGDGRIKKTNVSSIDTVGGDYYLWVRAVVGETEKTKCFGPYTIKDHTTLVLSNSEGSSTAGFLGNKQIQRGMIESVNIVTSLGNHSVDEDNCWDVSQSGNGKYLAWYTDTDGNGYYEVTIAGEGGVVANTNSTNLFAYIGYGTEKETKITGLENIDTGLVTNMSGMFKECRNVVNLEVSYFKTGQVTDMRYLFNNCFKLQKLDVSKWNISNVQSLFSTFQGCCDLTELNVRNWNTSNVTEFGDTMGYYGYGGVFQDCKNLTSLDLSKWNTSKAIGMGRMFCGCRNLTSLNLNNFDTSNVISMHAMFAECVKLEKLEISNFNTSKVKSMSSMFRGCTNLINLKVDNFDTKNVQTMGDMFYSCSSLKQIDLSNFDTSNVTNMGSMFAICSKITNINVTNFNTKNVTIMSNMFNGCGELKNIDVTNFNTSNVTTMQSMFGDCRNLLNVDVSGFDTRNVTSMVNMFWYDQSLTKLNLSNFKADKLTNIGGMFYICKGLKELDISDFDISQITNYQYIFTMVPSSIKITTNESTANWLKEKFPEYTNITIIN